MGPNESPKPPKPVPGAGIGARLQGLREQVVNETAPRRSLVTEALEAYQNKSLTGPDRAMAPSPKPAKKLHGAVAGGGEAKPKPKIRSTGTKHRPGRLYMKEYPVTEATLDHIGTLRLSAAFWFSLGSLTLGVTLSTVLSLSLAGPEASEAAKATWTSMAWLTGAVTLIAYIAGAFYFFTGKGVVDYVKENTVHDPID